MSYGIILGSHKSSSPKSQTKNRWAVGFFPSTILSASGLFEAFANARLSPLQFLDRRPELNVGHVVNFPAPRRNNKKKTQRLTRASSCWFYFVVFFFWLVFFRDSTLLKAPIVREAKDRFDGENLVKNLETEKLLKLPSPGS